MRASHRFTGILVLLLAGLAGSAHGQVGPLPPDAAFTFAPTAPTRGQAVTFDGSSSTDPQGSPIANYAWDLDGDGRYEVDTGTSPTTTRTYTAAGTYEVTLRVENERGFSDTATRTVTVREPVAPPAPAPPTPPRADPGPPPTAAFTAPRGLRPGAIGAFDASASTGSGRRFTWTFGGAPVDAGTSAVTRHGFTLPGDYAVALTVTDAQGRTATTQQTVHVAKEPQSGLVVRPAFPRPGTPVTFTAAAKTDAGAPIELYAWDFGDRRPGEQVLGGLRFPGLHPTSTPTARHTFAKAGVYTVVLKAVGTDGQVVRTTHRLRVGDAPRTGRGASARAAAVPTAKAKREAVKAMIRKLVTVPATEDALAPTMSSPDLPHTLDPVELTLSIGDMCTTVPLAGGGPLDDFEARINGDWVINPADVQKGQGVLTPELAGVPSVKARAAAVDTTDCFPLGTFRILSMTWGDGTKETPPEAFPNAAELTQKKTVEHTYTTAGTKKVTATVAVAPFGASKGPATITVSQTLDVVESYCGPLLVRGLKATVSGSDTGCWVPSALGYVAPTGAIDLAGATVQTTSPKGTLAVQGNEPGQQEATGNGTITAGVGAQIALSVGAQKVGTVKQLVIPAGDPHVLTDVVNAPFKVSNLPVAGGDLTLRNGGPPTMALRLRLPDTFAASNGQPSTVATGDVPAGQAADPATPVQAAGPPSLPFGSISIPGLSLTHDADGWHGGAELELGVAKIDAPDVLRTSGIGVLNDGFAYLGAKLKFAPGAGPNVLQILRLQSVSVYGSVKPTSLTGEVEMSVVDGNLFSVTGGLGLVWPEGTGGKVGKFCADGTTFDDTPVNGQPKPFTMRLCGSAKLLDLLPLGSAFLQVDGNGHVEFGGGVNYGIGDDWITASAEIHGSYDNPQKWQAAARGKICEHLISDECIKGNLWVTPVGAAACVSLWIADVGAYVRWKPFAWDYFLRSCGSRAPKYIGAASALAPPSAFGAALPPKAIGTEKDEAWHMIAVRGAGAAPRVTVTGPGGRTFTDDGRREQCVTAKGAPRACSGAGGLRHNGIMRSERTNTTLVYIADPGDATWKVEAQPHSAPITKVDHVEGLADPSLSGTVRTKAGEYTLDVKNLAQPGMKVDLVEEGAGKSATLKRPGAKAASLRAPVARAARTFESVRFRPAPGLGAKRQIVANISVDGIPWKSVKLASYTAPKDPVVTSPSKLTADPVAGGLKVSLAPGRSAAKTLVVVTTGAGRTFSTVLGGRVTSTVLKGYRKTEGATISASTIRDDGVRLRGGPTTKVAPEAPAPAVIGSL